jgi:hypothetical protein
VYTPRSNANATARIQSGSEMHASNVQIAPLPKHLEMFAQAIADGCNVREAAQLCGRKQGSGGYLNSRADVTQRVAEIRAAMAKASENHAATKMVRQLRSIEIDRNDIVMGLADIARYGRSESARVSAWNSLAEIFLLKAKNLRDLKDFDGWTTDELKDYALNGVVPERLRRFLGNSMSPARSTSTQ